MINELTPMLPPSETSIPIKIDFILIKTGSTLQLSVPIELDMKMIGNTLLGNKIKIKPSET